MLVDLDSDAAIQGTVVALAMCRGRGRLVLCAGALLAVVQEGMSVLDVKVLGFCRSGVFAVRVVHSTIRRSVQ
jgi:hypothetical protein